jgi:hypothetical protein
MIRQPQYMRRNSIVSPAWRKNGAHGKVRITVQGNLLH